MKQAALLDTIGQLVDKLSTFLSNSLLDHPLHEIRERAMKSLSLKLQGRLIPPSELVAKYPHAVGLILMWINEQQKTASPESLSSAIQILKAFAEDEEGRQVECKYGSVEFFSEYRKFAPSFLAKDLDMLISSLLKTRRHMVIPEPPVQTSAQPVPPAIKKESPPTERSKEPCEFPMITLSEAEEKVIFDTNVVIRYGDANAAVKACEQLGAILEDFPVECFLQRSDLLKTLMHRLENEKEFPFHRFAVPVLMKIVEKLRTAYRIYESSFSRPSELPALEKLEHKMARVYLEGAYPTAFYGEYEKTQPTGYTNKVSIDSMSQLVALGTIGKGSVKAMKDSNKIGSVILLYKKVLEAVKENYAFESERVMKEVLVPICQAFVEVIQIYGITEMCQDYMNHPILHAMIYLCEYMEGVTVRNCYRVVPKFYSALEEAVFFDVFEQEQMEVLKKVMEICNPSVVESLNKVQMIKEAIKYTAEYQQEKQAEALARRERGVVLKSVEDVENALKYLGQLIICLEFYSTRDSLLEEIVLKCIKIIIGEDIETLDQELTRLFVVLFKSPHDSHKAKVLKAILSDLKLDLGTVKPIKDTIKGPAVASFCCLPSIIDTLMEECIVRGNSELQVLYFQILVLIIDSDYGDEWRSKYTKHLATLQGLSDKFKELNRLIAKIEQTDQYSHYLRVMRDLFSLDEEKRKFATLAVKQKLHLDTISSDLHKDSPIDSEDILKLGKLNSMQINEFDARNLLNLIIQMDNLDFSIKKSALEQLTYYLTDPFLTIKKLLFTGKVSLFSHCVTEILSLTKELKGNTNLDLALHPSRLGYISQCIKFLSFCYIYCYDVAGTLFKQGILYNAQDISQCSTYEKVLEFSISGMASRNKEMHCNSKVLSYLLLFDPYIEIKRDERMVIYMDHVLLSGFQNVLNAKPRLKQLDGKKMLCNEQEKRLAELLVHKDENEEKLYTTLVAPLEKFIEECNKLDSYQNLMKSMDSYLNSLGSRVFSQKRPYPNGNFLLSMRKVLSVLPIGESEVHFLADFLENLSFLVFELCLLQADPEVLNEVNGTICKTFKKDVLPFLYEVGVSLEGKRGYIANLLEVLEKVIWSSRGYRRGYKGYVEYIGDQDFIEYVSNLYVCFNEDESIKRKIAVILLTITGPLNVPTAIMRLNTQSIIKNLVCSLNATEIGDHFRGTQAVHTNLCILQQLLKVEKMDIEVAGSLKIPKELADKFHTATITILEEYKSFGWLTRFLSHRHTKVRVKTWQILCDLVGTELLSSQPQLLQDSVETILRQSELYGIKIKAMDFLSRVLTHLLNKEEIGSEPASEKVSIKYLIEAIRKSGLISRCKGFFSAKDVPILFVGTLLDLLKKVIVADYKNVLSTLTQIDFWTLLADYLRFDEITKCDANDKRGPMLKLHKRIDEKQNLLTHHICMISVLEFVIECLFREPQLANHLLKSSKLLQHTFALFTHSITAFNSLQGDVKKKFIAVFDTYTNRAFTLWTLFAEHEGAVAGKILYDELSKAKCGIIVEAFKVTTNTIDSAAAVCRFVAKLAEVWTGDQLLLFEDNSFSQRIMAEMLKTYVVAKGGDNVLFNQQKYDIIKSMTVFVHKSLGAKTEVYAGTLAKQISADLTHLASILYCALIEGTATKSKELVRTKKSVMLNKAVVQREELLNVGCAHEMLTLLLQFLKSLFCGSRSLIPLHKRCAGELINSLLNVYEQVAIMDENLLIHLLEVLITLASQGQSAKELFLQKDAKRCFIELLLKIALNLEVGMNPDKIKRTFAAIQTLSLSKEGANYIWKSKFVDTVLKKLWPMLKLPQKDLIEAYPLILAITKFFAVYAYCEDGRKFLQLHKTLFEFYIVLLTKEPKVPTEITEAALMLLRNAAFSKGTKLHFLSLPNFADTLMGYATGINEKLRIKLLAASALWAYLYNHQGIKASLNKENIKNELELNKMEYERELDKIKYQEYHEEGIASKKVEFNSVEDLANALTNILRILNN